MSSHSGFVLNLGVLQDLCFDSVGSERSMTGVQRTNPVVHRWFFPVR